MPSFTRRECDAEYAIDRGDERGHVGGRFFETVGLGEVHHRLEQDAEHADRDRRRVRADRGLRRRSAAQRSRTTSASSRRMRLRRRVDLGRRTDALEQDDPGRGGIGDEAVDVRAHADFGEVVGRRGVVELVAHRVEQRAQAGLQRAVHRVFAVVEERVERGAARARAADDVFDRRVVIAARGEFVDRGPHEPAALIGAPLLGGEPAIAPSGRGSRADATSGDSWSGARIGVNACATTTKR